jgi:hypothetical protein
LPRLALDDPARYTAAEFFYLSEREGYRKRYPETADEGLKLLIKRAARKGLDLLRDSQSCRDELRSLIGADELRRLLGLKPYTRGISYSEKLVFEARGVLAHGERTNVIIPADFLTDPVNDFELRRYVERLVGDSKRVWKWYRQAEQVRNLQRSFRLAARGAADQGRPKGLRGTAQNPRARRPDVLASVAEFDREFAAEKLAAEENGIPKRGIKKTVLKRVARRRRVKEETLLQRLKRR